MKKVFTLFLKRKKLLFIAVFLLPIISLNTSWAQTAIFNPSMSITPYGSVDSNGSEGYANSIDNNVNTKFLDNYPDDGIGFTVDLGGISKIASSISVTTANDTPGRDPKNYEVLGSNDGSNFTSIATGTIQCISTRFSTRFYCFENSTAYKYYRVNFTNTCSEYIFQFAEVQLYTPGPGIAGSVSANQSISGVIAITPSGEANLNSESFVQIIAPNFTFDPEFGPTFTPGQTAAQSFKTSSNVILNAIKINVAEVIIAGSYTLTIFQGEGTSGAELMNQVVSITNSGTNTFSLDTTLALIGEQSYTFKLETRDGNAKFNWTNSSGSDYSRGSGYTNENNNNSDYNFQLVYQNNVNWQSVTLTGFFGGIQKWQKATDSNFSNPIDIPSISATLEPYLVGDIFQTTYFRAVVGCSSIYSNYVTIAVDNTNTTNTTTETACASYTWPVNGTTYITSGTYTSVMGSNTEILNLTITPSSTWYEDTDGDNYGNPVVSQSACTQPAGYVLDSTDCDDTIAAVNPGQTEVLYNGIDDNCNGQLDEGFQLTTNLQSISCGTTLPSIGSLIYANITNAVSGYRFKVVNNTTGAIQTINRSFHWFALNMLANYDYATTYTISVELQKAGIWLGYYGPTCSVSSPAVLSSTGALQVNPSQCGITLPSIGTVIATTPLSGATGYRFKVTDVTPGATGANLVQERDRSYHWFTLPMLSRFNYGSTYMIEVAVKTTAGYSAYGSACTVTTPSAPTLVQCGEVILANSTVVRTTPLNSVTQYRFQLTKVSDQSTVLFDRNLNWFTFRTNVPGYTPNTEYSVRIAVMTSGTWSAFGDACIIISPAAIARVNDVTANEFTVEAYPNPYSTEFKLNVTTSTEGAVELKVYDMLGKLIEAKSINTIDYISEDLGSAYPAGVYNVIVTQGENMKTLRLIKR
jgi:hypothetical protein